MQIAFAIESNDLTSTQVKQTAEHPLTPSRAGAPARGQCQRRPGRLRRPRPTRTSSQAPIPDMFRPDMLKDEYQAEMQAMQRQRDLASMIFQHPPMGAYTHWQPSPAPQMGPFNPYRFSDMSVMYRSHISCVIMCFDRGSALQNATKDSASALKSSACAVRETA